MLLPACSPGCDLLYFGLLAGTPSRSSVLFGLSHQINLVNVMVTWIRTPPRRLSGIMPFIIPLLVHIHVSFLADGRMQRKPQGKLLVACLISAQKPWYAKFGCLADTSLGPVVRRRLRTIHSHNDMSDVIFLERFALLSNTGLLLFMAAGGQPIYAQV